MDKQTKKLLAQNYRGFGAGNALAEVDTVLPEKNVHIGGTIPRGTSREFWLSRPRPVDISIDEWERLEQEKWDRIWEHKKEDK